MLRVKSLSVSILKAGFKLYSKKKKEKRKKNKKKEAGLKLLIEKKEKKFKPGTACGTSHVHMCIMSAQNQLAITMFVS